MPRICCYVRLVSATHASSHVVEHAAGSVWATDVPGWITAIATAGLLAGAIVVAIYAIKAFRKQSQEVGVLQEENKRDTAERRTAQASQVFIWHEIQREADTTQAFALTPDIENVPIEPGAGDTTDARWTMIIIFVQNTSRQPVYDLALRWRIGSLPWSGPQRWPVLMPDSKAERTLLVSSPKGICLDPAQVDASLAFRDAARLKWVRRLDGDLNMEHAQL